MIFHHTYRLTTFVPSSTGRVNSNWLSGYPCATAAGSGPWQGVLCHRLNASLGSVAGRVERLLLGENLLSGQLPTQMAELGALRELILRDNALTGTRRSVADGLIAPLCV